jgi:ribosomal-protein-alanine N-acetyltransferase
VRTQLIVGVLTHEDRARHQLAQVAPDHRRQGIASLLLNRLFELTAGRSRRGYTLEVRVSNAGAIKLYEELGFRPRGVRRGYYTDNREDALIMWREPWEPIAPDDDA